MNILLLREFINGMALYNIDNVSEDMHMPRTYSNCGFSFSISPYPIKFEFDFSEEF